MQGARDTNGSHIDADAVEVDPKQVLKRLRNGYQRSIVRAGVTVSEGDRSDQQHKVARWFAEAEVPEPHARVTMRHFGWNYKGDNHLYHGLRNAYAEGMGMPDEATPAGDGDLRRSTLADYEPREIDWLWPGRIPVGSVTILDGDPYIGKSTIIEADVPARVTRGSDWPDGRPNDLGSRNVVLFTSEDDPHTTIAPRLIAAGADRSRVLRFDRDEHDIVFPQDIKVVERAIEADRPALVVISPLEGYLALRLGVGTGCDRVAGRGCLVNA